MGGGENMNSYGKFDEYVGLAVQDAERASEIVAKSFYKILRKNGFSDAQIINVANNILDCLIQTLDSYTKREKSKENPSIEQLTG
jgi:hypothetical protein